MMLPQRELSTPITPEGFDLLGLGLHHAVCLGVEVLNTTTDGWSGDRFQRRHPRRRLGRRSHQTGGSVEMADRHPAGPLRCWANGCFTRKGRMSRAYAEDDATPECP